MTQADSVHSTPQKTASKINPPDPTRRHLLTIAAAGAVAAAIPGAVLPSAVAATADPIFAAIQTCRAAKQASDAAYARVNQLNKLAKERLGSDREQFQARSAFVAQMLGGITGDDPDDYTNGPAFALWDSYDAFAETVPTTLTGLFVMLAFADEITDRDPEAFNDVAIFSTFATAAEALIEAHAREAVQS